MIIKRTINFYPIKSKTKGNGNAPLRCYIHWNNKSHNFDLGYNVNVNAWNTETQRCKKNTFHDRQNIPAQYINKVITNAEDIINSCFEHFEQLERIPTKEELKHSIDVKTGKIKEDSDKGSFITLFDEYIQSCIKIGKWSYNTKRRIKVVRNQIDTFNSKCKITDFDNHDMPEKLLSFFLKVDNNNGTIAKKIKDIKAVLRYAVKKGVISNSHFLSYKTELKQPKKPIVFLSWEELMKVYHFDFSSMPHLDAVRDVFCFCCFTSLRYSDVANLKAENITNTSIHLTTIKTADTLDIELNKYSHAILNKYKGQTFKKELILPIISVQKMNEHLKEIAKMCELTAPITITTYKGTKRIETTTPKYELITTHAGRRTFISNAIMLGIPPEIVMKWSGHSDYKSMKPYIEIANKAKKEAMSLFDTI